MRLLGAGPRGASWRGMRCQLDRPLQDARLAHFTLPGVPIKTATLRCNICLPQLVAPSDVEAKFRELEGSNVDDELSKMKAALGSGKVAGQVRMGGVLVSCMRRVWPLCDSQRTPFQPLRSPERNCPASFPAQLPPGRPVSEAIDYELQDMKRRMGN